MKKGSKTRERVSGVHALARVAHLERNVLGAGSGGLVGLDRERAARRRGVAGVDGEVDDHLLELARVGAHVADGRVEPCDDLDVLADEPLHHRLDPADDVADLERLRLEDLAAAEGEELTRQFGRAVCRPLDLVEVAASSGSAAARSRASPV